MKGNDLASGLVRRLESMDASELQPIRKGVVEQATDFFNNLVEHGFDGPKSTAVKQRTDDDRVVEAAIETLRDINGVNIPSEIAYRVLEEVKKERDEASVPGKTKKYFSSISSYVGPIARNLNRATIVGGLALGAYLGIKDIISKWDYPGGYQEGVVFEKWENDNNHRYQIKVQTNEGTYNINLKRGGEGYGNLRRFSESITDGTKMRFPTLKLSKDGLKRGKFFNEGKWGEISISDIDIETIGKKP